MNELILQSLFFHTVSVEVLPPSRPDEADKLRQSTDFTAPLTHRRTQTKRLQALTDPDLCGFILFQLAHTLHLRPPLSWEWTVVVLAAL